MSSSAQGTGSSAQAVPDSSGLRDPRSLVAEAEKLRFSEDWYPAIDDYIAAIAKNPSYGAAYSGLAECYYDLGEYDQALSYVAKAAPFLEGDSSLANLEGFVRIGLGDLAGARKAFASVAARSFRTIWTRASGWPSWTCRRARRPRPATASRRA